MENELIVKTKSSLEPLKYRLDDIFISLKLLKYHLYFKRFKIKGNQITIYYTTKLKAPKKTIIDDIGSFKDDEAFYEWLDNILDSLFNNSLEELKMILRVEVVE